MNMPESPTLVAKTDGNEEEIKQAIVTLFNEQLHCLPIIKLFNRVTKSVQKHRASSIACLGGDRGYETRVEQLQKQIDKQLLLLNNFVHFSPKILTIKQLSSIQQDWHTIKVGWRHDSIIENFEFHGHLIDQIQGLIRNLCFHHFPEIENGRIARGEVDSSQTILLQCILQDIPDNIELIGKLRGLSVHATSTKLCDEAMQIRLEFMVKQSREQYRRLAATLKKLGPNIAIIPNLGKVEPFQVKLDDLLSIVEVEIMKSKRVIAKTDVVFNRSTEIIDLLWAVTEQGLDAVEKSIYDEIDRWTAL